MVQSVQTYSLLSKIGALILRYGLVLFFFAFGALKFTGAEAAGIAPLMIHSPFLFWVVPALGQQGGSDLIGVVELMLAAAVALRHFRPRLSGYGSLGMAGALIVTMSFLFTTPSLDPSTSFFLMKDLMLFGAALWTAGEAFAVSGKRAAV